MRSVAEIQREIDQVSAELAQAQRELEQYEASATEEQKAQDADPEWRLARQRYIDTGDMSGVSGWYTRQDQRKRDELDRKRYEQEQARLDAERTKDKESNKRQLANNVELAEAALASAKVANPNLSVAQQKAYVNEAQVKLDQAKAAYLAGTGEKWDGAVKKSSSEQSAGQGDTGLEGDDALTQQVRDTLAMKPTSGKVSAADLEKYVDELKDLKKKTKKVSPGSKDYDDIVEALADLRSDRGFQTIEDVAAADKKKKDEAESEEEKKAQKEASKKRASIRSEIKVLEEQLATAQKTANKKISLAAAKADRDAVEAAKKKVKELEQKIKDKQTELAGVK